MPVETAGQRTLGRGERVQRGGIVQLTRIEGGLVEFLGRALRERGLVVSVESGGIPLIAHEVLGGRGIDFPEDRRVPGRPTVRREIADVEELVRSNGAHWIANPTGAPRSVPLAGQDHVVAGRVDSALVRRCQHIQEAAARHGWQGFEPSRPQDRRGRIDEADEVADYTPPGNPLRPADGQRHAGAEVV